MNVQNPPSAVIKIEAEKAAFDNGYRIKEGVQNGWLHYRSTSVPGEIAIASISDHGPWHLKVIHDATVHELGSSSFDFESLANLYLQLDKVYRLAASLPDVPLQKFREIQTKLPQTTEVERLVIQRIGQNLFREALITYWNGRCPLTGITDTALLRASHIVAWANCQSDGERLDVHNGLLLSALWDAAFDKGLVSFSDDGMALFSKNLSAEAVGILKNNSFCRIAGLTKEHLSYLQEHRKRYTL